ncbi:MAG: hypothetical protein JWO56_595 [Acidobacteria bacterium]|nr:hypothetical protein [Acidobacteriota bacterium]
MLLLRILFSLLFGAVGLYLARVAGRVLLRLVELQQRGIVTEGEIVGFQEEIPTGERAGHTFYAPIITFMTKEGHPIRFTSSTSLRQNPYTAGQRVAIRYLPEDPMGADIESTIGRWWPFVALVVMMLVAFTIAALPIILPPPASGRL